MISANGDPARKISYAEVIGNKRFNVTMPTSGAGWDLKISPNVPVKKGSDYKVVGTPVKRTDLPAKFTGEFTYAQDVRIAWMLHGRVVRPPVMSWKSATVERSSIKQRAGVG